MKSMEFNIQKNRIIVYLALLFFTTIFLFFCSALSPFRPNGYLQYDTSVFYIIGSAMKKGKILYIDLIDHKGPYIFFINFIGAFICEYKHIGIFTIHVLIAFFTVYFYYKITMYFVNKNIVSIFTALTIFVIQYSFYFSHGGMQCETVANLFIAISFYTFCKYVLYNHEEKKLYKCIFTNGVLFSFVLFLKANIVLYFLSVVLYLFIDIVKNKQTRNLFFYFLTGVLGILVGALPSLIYCILTHSLNEMIFYSFTFNFIYLTNVYFEYKNNFDAIIKTLFYFKIPIIFAILNLYFLKLVLKKYFDKTKSKLILFFFFVSIVLNVFATIVGKRPYSHYANPLIINFLPFFIYIYDLILNKKIVIIFLIPFFLISSYYFSWNKIEKTGRENASSYKKLVSLIKNENSNNFSVVKNNNVLMVGYAMYVYDAFNTLPDFKYFCIPIVSKDVYSLPYDETLKQVLNRKYKYIVTGFNRLMGVEGYAKTITTALYKNYEHISKINNIDVYRVLK